MTPAGCRYEQHLAAAIAACNVLANPIIKSVAKHMNRAAVAAGDGVEDAAPVNIKRLLIGNFDLTGSSLSNRRRSVAPCGHSVQTGNPLIFQPKTTFVHTMYSFDYFTRR
jgi:hypothetical protein